MSATLYELASMRDVLDQLLVDTEGEVTPDLEELWAQLEGQTNEKIERWGLWLLDRSADVKKLKDEEARLGARRKALENGVERSKAFLHTMLDRLGKEKVQGLLCTVALQKNPPSVRGDLGDDLLVPMLAGEFGDCVVVVPASYRLDKKRVLERAKTGQSLPPGLTIEQTRSVRIR